MELLPLCNFEDYSKFKSAILLDQELDTIVDRFIAEYQEYYLTYKKQILETVPLQKYYGEQDEYQEELKDFQLQLLDELEQEKLTQLKKVLKTYNYLLDHKFEAQEQKRISKEKVEARYNRCFSEVRYGCIYIIIFFLLLPEYKIGGLIVGGTRIAIGSGIILKDFLLSHGDRYVLENIAIFQDYLYQIVDGYRDDYHNFLKKRKELEKQIMADEIVIRELLSFVTPDTIKENKVYKKA